MRSVCSRYTGSRLAGKNHLIEPVGPASTLETVRQDNCRSVRHSLRSPGRLANPAELPAAIQVFLAHIATLSPRQPFYRPEIESDFGISTIDGVTKPSLLHSRILFWATKAAEKHQDYVRFIKWWDLNHLRADDFKRSDKSTDGKEFPSLAESVSKALVKHVDSQRHSQDLEWIAKWLQTLCRQFSDNDWLPYRLAKVLVMLNRFEEARDLFVPIVRHKQGEPWAWHSLADTFSSLGDHNAIACLCRANNLGREEVYLRNVRLDLAEHFLAIGRTEEARREVDKVVSDCEQQGHNLPKKLQALLTRIPSTEVRAGSNTEVYAEFQPLADELLTEHLPWRNAIISGVVRREGKKDPLVFALVASESADDSTTALVPTPVTRQLDKIALGLPVAVKIEDSSKGNEVVAIRSRESTAWDPPRSATGRGRSREPRSSCHPRDCWRSGTRADSF